MDQTINYKANLLLLAHMRRQRCSSHFLSYAMPATRTLCFRLHTEWRSAMDYWCSIHQMSSGWQLSHSYSSRWWWTIWQTANELQSRTAGLRTRPSAKLNGHDRWTLKNITGKSHEPEQPMSSDIWAYGNLAYMICLSVSQGRTLLPTFPVRSIDASSPRRRSSSMLILSELHQP
jgi:hypothetical protein